MRLTAWLRWSTILILSSWTSSPNCPARRRPTGCSSYASPGCAPVGYWWPTMRLRHGRVADPAEPGADVLAMRRWLARCAAHPALVTSIVPLRDGVSVSVCQPL